MNKILVLTNNFGGLHSFRKEVMQALLDAGYEVMISAPVDEKTHFFEEMGCGIIDTQFNRKGTNPLKDMKLMFQYRKLIRKIRPCAVLSYTIKPNLYGGMACALCGVPQIANITGLGSAVENPGVLQKLTILLYKIGLRKTKTVFFQNQANMDFCKAHKMVRPDVCKLIPGSGVNLTWHTFNEYPEDGPMKFICLGRVMKEKGIEQYLACAEAITAKYPGTEFHIVGGCEEDYLGGIKDLEARGVVRFHDRQIDVRPFIAASHCTLHPSFYPEGMSNVLLESCAAGRPIITTDRPGCGEIVDDGVNGYVVKQRDSEDLIEKVENFINLPYETKKQMGLAARAKVEKEFDRQIVVEAYLKEIKSLS